MLHLITCHGRTMPRLAELLFCVKCQTKKDFDRCWKYSRCVLKYFTYFFFIFYFFNINSISATKKTVEVAKKKYADLKSESVHVLLLSTIFIPMPWAKSCKTFIMLISGITICPVHKYWNATIHVQTNHRTWLSHFITCRYRNVTFS